LNRGDAENAEISRRGMEPDSHLNSITNGVIGAAIEVHKILGSGCLEPVYEEVLVIELALREIAFKRRHRFNLELKGHVIGNGRIDLLVEDRLIVEIESVDALLPIHQAQLISYLKALDLQLGLILNFKVPILKSGIRRIIYTK